MGNKWFKSVRTTKDGCVIEELGDQTESQEDDFIQSEDNGGQSGDDVLPGCSTEEGMDRKKSLDKKGYQERIISFHEEKIYTSYEKQKKDKKPYLHPLKVWHFLDSERESNITGATITRDRRIVFADQANCSLKAYGLKVTNHFRIIRKRECRRSYVHLIENKNGLRRRYRPFDLCENERNKLVVTTGEEKVLLFVDLEGKKIDRVKEVEHDYRGIIYYHSPYYGKRLIAAAFDIGSVSIFDIKGNIIQELNCRGILHEPVYISCGFWSDHIVLTDRQNDRITTINRQSLSASYIDTKQKLLNSSEKNTVVESIKGIFVMNLFKYGVICVCDNRTKSVRRFEVDGSKYTELSTIKVGKEIQCIIYDDFLDEMYICPHRSNHALIWKRGGFVPEVTTNEPLPLKFSSPVDSALKPKLNEITISSNVLLSGDLMITDLVITSERKLVVINGYRILISDLNEKRNENQSVWSELKLEEQIQGGTILYRPERLCQYDTNKLAVTTGGQRALLLVDIGQKQIDQTFNTVAEYSFIIYHRNRFIVYQYINCMLCFLNKKGEELKRIIMGCFLEVAGISRFGDILLIPDWSKKRVLSISRHHKKAHFFQPDLSGFSRPCGITTDSRGIIYICDSYKTSVRRFNFTTKEELPSIDVGYPVRHIAHDPGSERLYLCCYSLDYFDEFLCYIQKP